MYEIDRKKVYGRIRNSFLLSETNSMDIRNKFYYSLCSMDLCGFGVFRFSMDLCAFSYVMLREKFRTYVSSLPYSTNLTYDKGIYFILFYAGTIQ